jgi:hypothetical protein
VRARGPIGGVVAAALVVLSTVALVVPDGKAVVTGGVIPCSGLPISNGPHYAAGTVTVLKGQVRWKSAGQGNLQDVLPTDVVAQQSVGTNGTYRFVLEPGRYVIQSGYAYTSVTLQPSADLYVDIPDVCI